jgi:hypothetical protein
MLNPVVLEIQVLLAKRPHILKLRGLTQRVQRMLRRLLSLLLVRLLDGNPTPGLFVMVPRRVEELDRISLVESIGCQWLFLILRKHQILITFAQLILAAKANLVHYFQIGHLCVGDLYLIGGRGLALNLRLLYNTRTAVLLFNNLVGLRLRLFKLGILSVLLLDDLVLLQRRTLLFLNLVS